ncbi:MAG: hypothetical protein M3P48_03585 [Actinomycetota bacterium]|nr:hypothetical protein [Actinomycetota bacterium]
MTTTEDPPASPYGLQQPNLADAYAAVARMYDTHETERVWAGLLATAGVAPDNDTQAGFDRVIATMRTAEPAVQLAARALLVRQANFTHLSAAFLAVRSSE